MGGSCPRHWEENEERLAGPGKEKQCCLAGLCEQVWENATRKVGLGQTAKNLESLGGVRGGGGTHTQTPGFQQGETHDGITVGRVEGGGGEGRMSADVLQTPLGGCCSDLGREQ